MNRKNFIKLAIGGLATFSASVAYFYLRDVKYNPGLAEPTSLKAIWDSKQIREIGKQYLSQMPDEKNKRTLVELLSKDLNNNNNVVSISLVNAKIKQDFETRNTVIVNGWILSVTEARQCALFFIQNNQ